MWSLAGRQETYVEFTEGAEDTFIEPCRAVIERRPELDGRCVVGSYLVGQDACSRAAMPSLQWMMRWVLLLRRAKSHVLARSR